MKPSLTTCAALSLAGLLAGCHHMPTRTDAVSVTEVLDLLKKELNAFANDSAMAKTASSNGKGCTGIHKVKAETVTVTLTTVGTRQVDGSVALGIPVFETNFSGALNEKETSKLVLPLQLVDTGDLATQNIKNMPLASALGKLRDELLAVNSAQTPCFSTEKDKRITLELSFEATRSGKGGVTLNVAPLKLATGGNRSSSATQTVAIGLKLEGVDGGSGTFQNPTQKPVQ